MSSCLVIKNDGIGDLIVSSGIISHLAEHVYEDLDLITCADNYELAELIPGIRHIFYVSRDNISSLKNYFKFFRKIPLLKSQRIPWSDSFNDHKLFFYLVTHKYDTVICLRRFIRRSTATLMSLVRAKEKYCCWNIPTNITEKHMERLSKGWMRNEPATSAMWEADYYALFLRNTLGLNINVTPRLNLPVCIDDVQTNDKSVGLIITDRGPRSWPDSYWIWLVQNLSQQGYKVCLFGSAERRCSLRASFSGNQNVMDYCGALSFIDHTRHFQNLAMVVAEDTGLAHLATLCGCRVLVLQAAGSTDGFFFPWRSKTNKSHVITFSMPCSGFVLGNAHSLPCLIDSRIECITRIHPEYVYSSILDILSGVPMPQRIDINKNAITKNYSIICNTQSYLDSKRHAL